MAHDPAALLRSVGDETRLELYQALAEATRPLTAAELADALGCHVNTVRLHLDRWREAGLVSVRSIHRGTVGRPQHAYSLADDAPSISFDPPAHALLAGLLAVMAERAGAGSDDAAAAGRDWGGAAGGRTRADSCVAALAGHLDHLGFEPEVGHESDAVGTVSIAFARCPFRELAEAYPELVCHLHRGICEGVVAAAGGGNVSAFSTLYDPTPCHVTVAVR